LSFDRGGEKKNAKKRQKPPSVYRVDGFRLRANLVGKMPCHPLKGLGDRQKRAGRRRRKKCDQLKPENTEVNR